jgi:hypothetical protein
MFTGPDGLPFRGRGRGQAKAKVIALFRSFATLRKKL